MDSNLMGLDELPTAGPSDDLSSIAWVHEELRRSLEAAHKSLRRFLKDTEAVTGSDIDSVDPGVLRAARAQIHQGVGALELVGLPAAAIVLRASETAVQRAVAKPLSLTPDLVSDLEHASFGLLDYLQRLLNGKQVSSLSLFPLYRAVQESVEAERVHPADLWPVDWRWREVASDPDVVPRQADTTVRGEFESHLLSLMRGTQQLTAAAKMSEICAGLGAGTAHPQVRTFWNLSAAMFEAQHHGLLGFDVFTKRVASRLLAQFRLLSKGDSDVSERLARDILFFCSQAAPAGRAVRVPRLDAVREAYAFVEQTPTDYTHSVLGRFDPAIVAHAKKRVVAAKESWSATAGGEMHRLAGLSEQFALVGDSLRRLFPFGEAFATEMQTAVVQTQQSQAAPPAPLAMEVATSLLYLEAALEDGDFDQPEHAERIKRLGERLSLVRQKQPPEPLETWMEELYRRVSDRQTMGSVVQELRASLSEVEKAIDKFFRNPGDHASLIDVPVQLGSMRGVLSVLGMDAASQALLRMRSEVDGLVSTDVEPDKVKSAGVFERLAGNLSALGFMIDMLSVQPHMAKSLFVYDAEAGTLAPVMGRSAPPSTSGAAPVEPRLIEQAQMLAFQSVREDVPVEEVTRDLERLSHEAQAADQPALAAAVLKAQEAIGKAEDAEAVTTARGELSEALVDFVATSTEPTGFAPVSTPSPLDPVQSITLIGDDEHDDEMREVFLEEAREVIESAQAACADLHHSPDDLGLLTTLRRAFHTLKGSSRMVGLNAFGEAAWACEQIFNTQLADQRAAETSLLDFAVWVLGYLGQWVEDISAKRDSGRDEREVKAAAERLGRGAPLSSSAAADISLPIGLPPGLPTRADLDMRTTSVVQRIEEPDAPEDLSFELDLSGFDKLVEPGGKPGAAPPVVLPSMADPSPMFDPFDDARDRGMQTTLTNEQFDAMPTAPVDLDLGTPADTSFRIDIPPAPAATGFDSVAGIELDLSIDEPMPVGEATDSELVDLDVGADAPLAAAPASATDEHVKVVGPLRIGIPLFNIYLNEADELSRRLVTEVAEWAMELHRPVGEVPIALAHSLAGSSATVGFADLSHLARLLEHALARTQVIGRGTDEEARLFVNAAEEIRRLLHQFAAGFLQQPAPDLLARLAEHELTSARRLEAVTAASELAEGKDSESPAERGMAAEPLLSLDEMHDDAVEPTHVDEQATATMPTGAAPIATVDAVETVDAVADEPLPEIESVAAPIEPVAEVAPAPSQPAPIAELEVPAPIEPTPATPAPISHVVLIASGQAAASRSKKSPVASNCRRAGTSSDVASLWSRAAAATQVSTSGLRSSATIPDPAAAFTTPTSEAIARSLRGTRRPGSRPGRVVTRRLERRVRLAGEVAQAIGRCAAEGRVGHRIAGGEPLRVQSHAIARHVDPIGIDEAPAPAADLVHAKQSISPRSARACLALECGQVERVIVSAAEAFDGEERERHAFVSRHRMNAARSAVFGRLRIDELRHQSRDGRVDRCPANGRRRRNVARACAAGHAAQDPGCEGRLEAHGNSGELRAFDAATRGTRPSRRLCSRRVSACSTAKRACTTWLARAPPASVAEHLSSRTTSSPPARAATP